MRQSATFLLALVAAPALANAQGIIIPRCPPPRRGIDAPIVECLPARAQVVRSRSDVRVELRDRVLRYEVEERFVNRGGLIGEADYVFPLPKGAAFRDLKLSIDGELVAGETMGATEARRIYEDIVRRQRDPALVEWMGHGLLRARIFPIQPGEERRVVVRYERVSEREGDAVRVDYFRGTSPRSGPWALGSETQSQSSLPRAQSAFTLTYRAGGELGEPYSPTHELDVERDGVVRRVTVRGGGPDVTLLVALRRASSASVSLLANASRDEPGFALITVTPPDNTAQSHIPRDVTFVVDVSGSMSGRKLEQAKAAGRRLLETLTDRDRFQLIDFSTDVRRFRDGFTQATAANVREARRYLDALDATGGTNIGAALEAALNGERDDRRDASRPESLALRLVLFMTDGAPTVGDRDPASIAARAAKLRADARVFSFGIGADVNVSLIEQLALEGRGTASFVRPDESVERAVELLATRLRQPLVTDVRVSVDGPVRLSRAYPAGELDIFAGQDLVLLARYEGSGPATVVVQGRAGGRDVRWESRRNFPRDERENAFVPRLWATQRLGWLAAEKRRAGGGASAEIDDEIRRLGERFGIPTEFTSYLVQEPQRVAGVASPGRGTQPPGGGRRELRLDEVVVTGVAKGTASSPAPPPAASEAFEAARAASQQRAAKSVAAADLAVAADAAGSVKRAGNRLFQRDGARWVDTRMQSRLTVYKVQAYSRSYFELLEKLPELRDAFAVGDRVVVAGRSVAIEVVGDAERASDLSAADMQSILKGW